MPSIQLKNIWICVACFFLALAPAHAEAQAKDYQVKAVFLFNFAQFVEWPTNAFADARAPLVIGVLGEDPFGAFLDETVKGETINGRPLAVHRFQQVTQAAECHILFVSQSESQRLEQIFAALKGKSILTVGDSEGFAKRGGMIRFLNENNKVRLRISLESARAANLTISSKLLRPAHIVEPGKD